MASTKQQRRFVMLSEVSGVLKLYETEEKAQEAAKECAKYGTPAAVFMEIHRYAPGEPRREYVAD